MKSKRLRRQNLSPAEQQIFDEAEKMLAAGQLEAAGERCRKLVLSKPRALTPLRLLSWIDMRSGNIFAAHEAAEATVKLAPTNAMVVAWAAEVAAEVGNLRLASEHRKQVESLGSWDSTVSASIAASLTASEDHIGALVYFQRLLKDRPDNMQALLNVAYSARYVGDFEQAETCLLQLIAAHPDFYQAYFALTQLGKASTESSHIPLLESALHRSGSASAEAESFLGYGLGKEYEDMGDNSRAFQYYQSGARSQRKMYPRPSHEAAIARSVIAASVGGQTINDSQVGEGLIFVVGLPRAGSTLLDRMLGAHSRVHNGGELRALPFCAHRQLQLQPTEVMSPGLLSAMDEIDVRALAAAYKDCLPSSWLSGVTLTDKNPLNYLYVGLIRRALPAAKILHIYRNPMDACFSSYKQLFAPGAYRHSYDLDEVAQHYAAYQSLMNHWLELYGDSLVELSYESLVTDMESQLRRVLPALGLDWEDGILDFHLRKTAVGTASFAQVRQPVYTGSVERWRLFAEPLQPLADALQDAGVSL